MILRMSNFYIVVAFALSGCSGLPAGGPTSADIIDGSSSSHRVIPNYTVIDITPEIASRLSRYDDASRRGHFSQLARSGVHGVGVGDTLSVTIFEASTGGLFSPQTDTTTSGAPRLNLPPQVVDRLGTITVPYAGAIRAAGRTPQQIQDTIQTRLAKRAIEPQAVVSIISNESRVATVTGDVWKGGRIPLTTGNERVLDALGIAGGQRGADYDTTVKLIRKDRSETMNLQDLVNAPSENIVVEPGDQIFVSQDPQKFIVLGASTTNAEVPFGSSHLSLAEALGKSGGLDDRRADPAGIFVFRYEDPRSYGVLPARADSGGKPVPVVYRLNVKQPSGLLAMQSFMVHNKDVIYFANSPSTELSKFLGLVGTGVGITNNTATTVVRVAP
jgi:polysaccharide export outer membrane protein